MVVCFKHRYPYLRLDGRLCCVGCDSDKLQEEVRAAYPAEEMAAIGGSEGLSFAEEVGIEYD